MTDNRETIEQFIKRNGITLTLARANNNPHMDHGDGMHHYRATLSITEHNTADCEHRGPRSIATCGRCGRSWCDDCDPAPSALCHYCHGRGYSTAPRGRRSVMTIPFSTGSGWTTEPAAADVLSCLASDSASVADSSFEEWAADMGYDEDSRKAERIFRACEDQAEELRALLGEEEYENLLYNTEEA